MEPISQHVNNDQVCIRCKKELIEGHQFNNLGSKFRDDQKTH